MCELICVYVLNLFICIRVDGGYVEEDDVHYIVLPAPLMCKSSSDVSSSDVSSSSSEGEDGEVAFGYLEFFSDGSGMALQWYGNKPSAAAYPAWPKSGVKLPFTSKK